MKEYKLMGWNKSKYLPYDSRDAFIEAFVDNMVTSMEIPWSHPYEYHIDEETVTTPIFGSERDVDSQLVTVFSTMINVNTKDRTII